jgi:hypothetical protein
MQLTAIGVKWPNKRVKLTSQYLEALRIKDMDNGSIVIISILVLFLVASIVAAAFIAYKYASLRGQITPSPWRVDRKTGLLGWERRV